MVALARKPFDHQKVGARFLVNARNQVFEGTRQRGVILADDMGLGKTYTVLLAALAHKQVDPTCRVFVIAPKSLLRNWEREAAYVGLTIDGLFTNSAASFPAGHTGNFVLIVDEAHAFQDHKSQRTQKLLGLCDGQRQVKQTAADGKVSYETIKTGSEVQAVYLLTGTPVKNGRPSNLLPLLQAIKHGLVVGGWHKIKAYLDRYCGPKKVWTGRAYITTYDGATNLDELHALTKPSILRRLKGECLDLPAKIRTQREVELTPAEREAYGTLVAQLRDDYRERLKAGKIKGGGEKLVFLGQLRLAGALAKVREAIEIAEEVIEQGGQVAIFTSFREAAAQIAAHFGCKVLNGDASANARQQIVDDFQAGKDKVFVGITQAGGVGITLTKGQTVILLDRPWTPGDAIQVEDRCHRIGQTGTVNAIWLQYGIDDYVDSIILSKYEKAEQLLSGTVKSLAFETEAEIAEAVIERLGW